jgi:hypothetical protein
MFGVSCGRPAGALLATVVASGGVFPTSHHLKSRFVFGRPRSAVP